MWLGLFTNTINKWINRKPVILLIVIYFSIYSITCTWINQLFLSIKIIENLTRPPLLVICRALFRASTQADCSDLSELRVNTYKTSSRKCVGKSQLILVKHYRYRRTIDKRDGTVCISCGITWWSMQPKSIHRYTYIAKAFVAYDDCELELICAGDNWIVSTKRLWAPRILRWIMRDARLVGARPITLHITRLASYSRLKRSINVLNQKL